MNTPKQLRAAEEFIGANPGLGRVEFALAGRARARLMTDLSSRNFEGLEAFAFEPRRVEKPWGYELIWAHAEDLYVGKILFVKAGCALSLQFHNLKDETWYFLSGRAEVEIGEAGDATPNKEVVGARRRLPHRARGRSTGSPRSRTRRSSRRRRPTWTTSSGSKTSTDESKAKRRAWLPRTATT